MRDQRRDMREYMAPALVTALGVVVRLAAAVPWNADHPDSPARLRYGDEPSYDAPARAIFENRWFDAPDRLPLYPLWLAFWHALTGFDYDAVVYAQCVLGAAAVPLTWLLGRRLAGRTAAFIAAACVAVSPTLTQQALHFIPEVMFTVAVLGAALLLVTAWQAPTTARFAMAGALVGVANLIRPTLLFLPLFVVAGLWLFTRRRRDWARHAAAYAVAAYLVTAPWTIRNYLVHDAFLPLSTSNATLWLGSPEYHHLIHDRGYTYRRVWDEIIYPDDPRVPYPTSIEGEQYWSERGVRSIRREPLLYARLVLERLGTYWVGDPVVDWGGGPPLSYRYLRARMSAPDALIRLAERALPIFALIAVAVLWRRRRELLPLYVILTYVTLLHAATVARIRMSDPFRPLLLLLVSAAVVALARAWSARRRGSAPATGVANEAASA